MTPVETGRSNAAPLAGVLWDEGGLTKDGAVRFCALASPVLLTPGPRNAVLKQAAGAALGDTDDAVDLTPQTVDQVLAGVSFAGPIAFLGAGAPFDARSWVTELEVALERSGLAGLVIVIPGPKSGPFSVLPLTTAARSYIPLIQNGIATGLGHSTSGHSVPGSSSSPDAYEDANLERVVAALENQIGDIALAYATRPYTLSGGRSAQPRPKAMVGAADVIHVIMKDTCMEVTNRTAIPVELRIHLGAPGGEIMETLEVFLEPRSARTFAPEELGSVGLLPPPQPELRQWSHEAEVVYEGGQRRIHLVEVHYLRMLPDPDGKPGGQYQVIGADQFGSLDAVVSGTVSTEISRAIGKHSRSMGERMADLATRQDWRHVLQGMVAPQ